MTDTSDESENEDREQLACARLLRRIEKEAFLEVVRYPTYCAVICLILLPLYQAMHKNEDPSEGLLSSEEQQLLPLHPGKIPGILFIV